LWAVSMRRDRDSGERSGHHGFGGRRTGRSDAVGLCAAEGGGARPHCKRGRERVEARIRASEVLDATEDGARRYGDQRMLRSDGSSGKRVSCSLQSKTVLEGKNDDANEGCGWKWRPRRSQGGEETSELRIERRKVESR